MTKYIECTKESFSWNAAQFVNKINVVNERLFSNISNSFKHKFDVNILH